MRLRLRDSTYRMYEERLDYTIRDLGLEFAEEIDPIRIDAYVRKRLDAGLSPRTVNIQVAVVRRMLIWAVEEGLITRNAWSDGSPCVILGRCRDAPSRKMSCDASSGSRRPGNELSGQ